MTYEIRPQRFGEILDGAFQLYRNHFRAFVTVSAVTLVPAAIAQGLLTMFGTMAGSSILLAGKRGAQGEAMSMAWGVGLGGLVAIVLALLAYLIQTGALTAAIGDAYLGRPVSARRAFDQVFDAFGRFFGTGVRAGLWIALGFVAFVIPGLLLALRWMFWPQAVLLEGGEGRAALVRSTALTNGRRGRLLLLALVIGIVQSALAGGVQILMPRALISVPILGTLLAQIPGILIGPLYPAVLTLAYFDARVRDEAFDLELLGQATAGPAPSPASGT